MTHLEVVIPNSGRFLHLYVDNYAPGRKARSGGQLALCNAPAYEYFGTGKPSGRCRVSFDEASTWNPSEYGPFDRRPTFDWCRTCLGHALVYYGLTDGALRLLATRSEVSA